MAIAPERIDPVFGDALAGDGGMSEPVSVLRSDAAEPFADALSALPLPALTLAVPPTSGLLATPGSAPVRTAAPPAIASPTAFAQRAAFPPPTAFAPPAAGAAGPPTAIPVAPPYRRPAAAVRQARPVSPARPAGGVVAPGVGRRPVAGSGYVPPTATTSVVVRPPAYLPQRQGLAPLRAALQQSRRSAAPPPASPPAAVRPAPASGGRPTTRASSVWSVIVFAVILLVSTGLGQHIVHAVTELLHRR